MNRTVSLAFLSTLLASPLAFAQPDGAAGSGGDGGDSSPRAKRHQQRLDAHFDKLDADKSGAISLDEMKKGMRERLADADANDDGKITRDEMKAHHQAKRAEMQARRAQRGTAGEGEGKRFGKHGKGKHLGKHGKGKHFDRLDDDGDGVIELAELDARAAARFTELDTDGNGQVTREELAAGKGRHCGKGGHHGKGFHKRGKGNAGAKKQG